MRKLLRALLRGLAAIGLVTLATVWEAGRWVTRAVRAAFAPPQQAEEAEAAVEAEAAALDQLTRAEPSSAQQEARQHVHDFGQAALSYLAGDDAQRAQARRGLDDGACEWLDSLSLEQAKSLLGTDPRRVAAHILGEEHIAGLPRPESLEDGAARLGWEARRHEESYRVLQESVDWMLDPADDHRGERLGLQAA